MVIARSLEDILFLQQSVDLVAGVDEVGRGPLAGPVVTAAVILDNNNPIEGLTDSKKLSEKRRESVAKDIKEKALGGNKAEGDFMVPGAG